MQPIFSHIYVENDAFSYPLAKSVMEKLSYASIIPINHYKDVFCRAGQDFDVQKQSIKLILAVKRAPFMYPAAEVCANSVFDHTLQFYYVTQMMNCPFQCEYCFLRGMYNSGNIVAFVNVRDYFDAVPRNEVIFLSISYEADLLAMESLFRYVESWIRFAVDRPNATLEIRTKSASYSEISHLKPVPNVILSWSVSPEAVIKRLEHKTPRLPARIEAVRSAIEAGWKVRLCMDPIIISKNWKKEAEEMIETLNSAIDMSLLYDVVIGGFRVSKTYYRRMRKMQPFSEIFTLPLVERDGVMRYSLEQENEIQLLQRAIGK